MKAPDQDQQHMLWEALKKQGWELDVPDSIRCACILFQAGMLDRAKTLARTLLPVLLANPPSSTKDWQDWTAKICSLIRMVYLADSSDLAFHFLEEAIDSQKAAAAPKTVLDALMGEAAYLISSSGDTEKLKSALNVFLCLVEKDLLQWMSLADQNVWDFILLYDTSVRLIDICILSSILNVDVVPPIAETAKGLYWEATVEQSWMRLTEDSPEAKILELATRQLATAVRYLHGSDLGEADLQAVDAPYIDIELAFLDFQSSLNEKQRIASAQRFLDAYRNWRQMIVTSNVRSALRKRMSLLTTPFLKQMRKNSNLNWLLVSEAEETLGPSRWLDEKLAEIGRSTDELPQIAKSVGRSGGKMFCEEGAILHLIPTENDLLFVYQSFSSGMEMPEVVHGGRISDGARRLRRVHAEYFGASGKISIANDGLVSQPNKHDYHRLRLELNDATDEAVGTLGDVMSAVFVCFQADHDVLLVCSDPALLCLPWLLARNGDRTLIESIRSLTLSASIGASGCLGDIAGTRPQPKGLDIAAYCDCTELRWDRLFVGVGDKSVTLRTVGVKGRDMNTVSVQCLESYSSDEADVLLIAGHGNARLGVRLGNDHWNPLHAADKWRLERTQCAILPSCCLGQLLWASPAVGRLNENVDPEKHEITGFLAHLCLARIPRIVACPSTAYDLPVSELINKMLLHALALRRQNENHVWARALRDTIVARLKEGTANLYDLANIMVFGAP